MLTVHGLLIHSLCPQAVELPANDPNIPSSDDIISERKSDHSDAEVPIFIQLVQQDLSLDLGPGKMTVGRCLGAKKFKENVIQMREYLVYSLEALPALKVA